jgi:hypothetical protein
MLDIGKLLTVDLDAHEVLVQHSRDLFVLEGVVLHHVTPIAGGIANREKDGLVLSPSSLKDGVAPGVPPDRIIFMLA